MRACGFQGPGLAIAAVALAGWVLAFAPGVQGQPEGPGKGKGGAKSAEKAAAQGPTGVPGKARAADDEDEVAQGRPAGKGNPADSGRPGGMSGEERPGNAERRGPDTDRVPAAGQGEAKRVESGPAEAASIASRIAKEQRKHLKNMARIQRIAELGREDGKAELLGKAEALREKEQARHQRAMKRLQQERPRGADRAGVE